MKPNYKNWVPKGMVIGFVTSTVLSGILFVIFTMTDLLKGTGKKIAKIISGMAFIGSAIYSIFCINLYRTFSYNGKKQLSRQIIDKISDYVVIPENGKGLDIGCGSGALTIACAKKNPTASMIGLDRWGKEYASYNKPLCEKNAEAEGVSECTSFIKGDACHLDFPNETFDAVTSNYCYHNILSRNRQDLILETLRVLKKGGTFAIHDEFTKGKYGDIQKLVEKLNDMGYEKVEFFDTTDGLFMTKKEAIPLCLAGSGLLVGKK